MTRVHGKALSPAHDAFNRLQRAAKCRTGCYLTAEMVGSLSLTIIGQLWNDYEDAVAFVMMNSVKIAKLLKERADFIPPVYEDNPPTSWDGPDGVIDRAKKLAGIEYVEG